LEGRTTIRAPRVYGHPRFVAGQRVLIRAGRCSNDGLVADRVTVRGG
jgi:hypothetical protein